MKQSIISLLLAATFLSSAYAQIGSSTNHTIQTTVEEEIYEVTYNRIYNRIYGGYGSGFSDVCGNYMNKPLNAPSLNGVFLGEGGWTIGIPISKEKDLYIETGLNFNYKDDEVGILYEEEFIGLSAATFEIPVNLTYRFNMGNRIFISPYLGCYISPVAPRVKFSDENTTWESDEFQFSIWGGFTAGLNIDFKKLYVGICWEQNMVSEKLFNDSHFYDESTNMLVSYNDIYSNMKFKYKGDFRIRIGITLQRCQKRRIQ